MKFKIDENLPNEIADLFRETGHDAVTVFDQGMQGKQDSDLLSVCRYEERVFITLDLDFTNIQTYPPSQYCGIIVVRSARQDKALVLETLTSVIPMIEREPLHAHLWIVDESSLRIWPGE